MRNKDGLMKFWQKVPAFLWPSKENFRKVSDEPIKVSLIYLLIGLIFFAAANIIFNLEFFAGYEIQDILYMLVITLFTLVIFLFLTSAISFGVAKLLGAKYPYKEMAKVIIYSFTPAYLFGWLPSIGFLAIALSFGNIFAGVVSIFRLNIWKSIMVASAPLISFFLLFLLLVSLLFQNGAAV